MSTPADLDSGVGGELPVRATRGSHLFPTGKPVAWQPVYAALTYWAWHQRDHR